MARIVGTKGNDVLKGTGHKDVIIGKGGHDKLIGKGGNDVLKGGNGKDILNGGSGNDKLYGGDGTDGLKAGGGNDLLVGGHGSDGMAGGGGADVFSFRAGDGTGNYIHDYNDIYDYFAIPGPGTIGVDVFLTEVFDSPVGAGTIAQFSGGVFFVKNYFHGDWSDSDFI